MNNENFTNLSTKKRFFPDLKEAWILVLCMLPLIFIASALSALLKTANIDDGMIILITYLASCGSLVCIALFYKRSTGDSSQICYKNKVSVLIYVLVVPAIIGLGNFSDIFSSMVLPEIPQQLKDVFAGSMNFNFSALFTAVVAAPVLEEIFCRGIICEGLIKNYSPRAAILWSALIFAVIHLNPWQGFSAFVIGCFLGWIYWKTRSLLPCIFIHFVNNGLAVGMYNYHKELGYDIDKSIAEIYGFNEIVLMIICFVMFLASCFLLAKKLNGHIEKAVS